MDPGLEEKGLALPLPPKPLFFPGGCQTTLNHRPTGKQLLDVTHDILLVTAGRVAMMTGWSVPTWPLAGCLAEQDYGRTMVWNINCAK